MQSDRVHITVRDLVKADEALKVSYRAGEDRAFVILTSDRAAPYETLTRQDCLALASALRTPPSAACEIGGVGVTSWKMPRGGAYRRTHAQIWVDPHEGICLDELDALALAQVLEDAATMMGEEA